MSSMNVAAIVLLANAVYVDGECCCWNAYDGAGATVNGVVLKEDADGVVTIPADWTVIPEDAFRYCDDLKKVLIPAKIRAIENNAFYFSGLEVIEFAAGSELVSIGKWASSFTNIVTLDIPSTVTSLGERAFWESKIISINIPSSVAAFDAENVFQDTPCDNKDVFQPGTAVENCEVVTKPPTSSSTASPSSQNSPVPSVEPVQLPSRLPSEYSGPSSPTLMLSSSTT
eukprot:CAMPEP_0194305798 /NCGR_PEP_ID=MMETSP0171-20130528/3146_1 /TAXON_ID=218684 /ORGANISM="Corethron pennatum, Strain L29A3" /LENGTH=227 /DNA_ID=CAMNT_0039057429 /DNA_START=101 /DNA_END=780 /DNA_ORIENTATION=+